MKTEVELQLSLARVEKIIERISKLNNPPEELKIENENYRLLLEQQYVYRWILEHKGYDFIDAYDKLEKYLNEIEN
ncbi:hypothetical protein M0D21_07880 [Aquimarina sp. D1M17]|uniref:hypothetical protein n=1 Tax=Aquimarina acroporae TaxID=2937283 RepID=UPI0020BEE109|nr:hypothetical protein [Aquimarina acroporae]MCK8521482.1 hypothetical protein [Aquimarina acroporae]